MNPADAIARIKRAQAETRNFVAGQGKLGAEADKLRRDRFLAPVVTAAAVTGAVSALLPRILRSWGLHP